MKKPVSLFLCLLLLLSLFPFSALAEDGNLSDVDEGGLPDAEQEVGDSETGMIRLSEEYLCLNAWDSTTLYTDCSPESVVWFSSDDEVASVEDGTVTAHRRGEAVITACMDLPDGGAAVGECFVEVLSSGFLVDDPADLRSAHPYDPGENAFWQYTLAGAEGVLVSFDQATDLGDGFLLLADGTGEAFYSSDGTPMSFSGGGLAGQTLHLPGDSFRIYLQSFEDSGTGWGFAVTDVRSDTESDDAEEPDEPEDFETPEESEEPEDTQSPEGSEEPKDTQLPEESEEPEDTQLPEESEEPEDTQTPEEPEEPKDTKSPEEPDADTGGEPIVGMTKDDAVTTPLSGIGPKRILSSEALPLGAVETSVVPSGEGGAPTAEEVPQAEEAPAASGEGDAPLSEEPAPSDKTPAPTATVTLLPAELTMDALSEEAVIASVIVPEGTDLSTLSIAWESDSTLITVTEKNLMPNESARSLTGTATVTAGAQSTETPATVTATVMYVADASAEPVPVKVSDAEDAADAQAASAVTVRSRGIVVSDWHGLESEHYYSRPIHTFWQYTVPDPTVQSVTLTFDTMTEMVSPQDILRVADGAGRPAGVYTGRLLAGQSVTVPGRVVRIYLDSDESGFGAWGFKVTNLTTVSSTDAPRYSVRYYANGGVKAPKDQPAGELPLTLSADTPTREHYTFMGWATDRDSGATYQPGEVIETLDPNTLVGKRLDLFAVWERIPTFNDENRGAASSNGGPAVSASSETKSTPANPILVERPETRYDREVLHIRTVEDLMAFAENCSLDTWSDGLPVVLDNDLSLSGVDFWAVPIFNGCFDGRNHTIYDLSLTDAMAPCGFFLELGRDATVKNLNVSGSVVPGGDNSMTGGLVGLNRGMVLNCSFSGSVTGVDVTGGIAGCNEATGILSGCRSAAAVSGMNATGGIAGHNRGAVIACESSSFVNVDSVDPALNIQTLDTSSVLNFIESLSSETVGVTTDTGGIVGFNEGFVETCIAREAVGYQHLGYNVGGICGRSDGYIDTCLNEADVYGRRDVGGILGQAEPYIELREDNSILAGLSYRVYALHQSIRTAAGDAEVLGDDIAGQLSSLSRYVSPLESALTAFDISDPTADALEEIREAVRNMVSGVSGELESMGASVEEGSSVLADDLNSISDNLSALSGTAIQSAQLISSSRKSTVLEDISVSEAESELTLGKTSGCTNRGEVRGDNNVGGIVGCMSIENELDPESDLTNTDFLTRRQNRYRIVVAECLNDGPVTAKKECAGGIAGRVDIGYIARSVAYNGIALEDGAYAGGIAGLLYGTVGASVAKCSLTGEKYVGGIVGNGHASSAPDDKPSLVSNCYTLVDIRNRPQFSGAVSGGGEGSYTENYFVSSGYAGLNRLSVQGQAEPVLFSVFSSLNALPEETRHFTLRFVVEGETVKELPFEYGASFGRGVFPEMPVKDGAYAVWDRTELTDLRFDTVVTAEYRRSETALKSDLCREDGRAVGYVVGQFQQGDTLALEQIPVEQRDIEVFRLNWRQAAMEQLRSVLDGEPDYSIPINVLEHVVFRYPDDGLEEHILRYLSPNETTENIRVYQKSDGGWIRLQPETFGSYLSVLCAGESPELCLLETMQSWWILVWVAGALLVVFLLILALRALHRTLRSRPPKEKPEGKGGVLRSMRPRRRRRLLMILVLLAAILLCLALLLQSDRLRAGLTSVRLLRDFYGEEADIDTEILFSAGEDTMSLDSTVHRVACSGNMIECADQYGIPLYICNGNIYLENGRAFRILNHGVDRKTVLRLALEAFLSGDVTLEREGDSLRWSADLDPDRISKTLRTILSEEIEGLLEMDSLSLSLAADAGKLSAFTFLIDGRLEDGKTIKIDVSLHPEPLSERPVVPQTVLDAIDAGGRGTELLTNDLLALLAAWIRYDNAPGADAEISVSVDAGLLTLNDRYRYFRQDVDGTDIHAVSNRLFTVYFTDSAACTANGTALGSAETALKDIAGIIGAARDLCLDGSFHCETLGSGRVYTLTLPADHMESMVKQILPELSERDIQYDDCVLSVTLKEDALASLELKCGGTLTIVTRELDASADVVVRFTEPAEHRVPDNVKKTLLS